MIEKLYCWAWTPIHVGMMKESEAQKGRLLIMPEHAVFQAAEQETSPYIAHFTRLDPDETCWMWLFGDMREALALRMLPTYAPHDRETELIRCTLKPDDPVTGAQFCYLQTMPIEWLKEINADFLRDENFKEVWMGFDHRTYSRDRSLRTSARTIMSLDEWQEYLRRA